MLITKIIYQKVYQEVEFKKLLNIPEEIEVYAISVSPTNSNYFTLRMHGVEGDIEQSMDNSYLVNALGLNADARIIAVSILDTKTMIPNSDRHWWELWKPRLNHKNITTITIMYEDKVMELRS